MLWDNTLSELFFKGGFAMYPLLGFSLVGLAILLDRLVTFAWLRSRFAFVVDSVGPLVQAGQNREALEKLRRQSGPVARVAATYLENVHAPADVRNQLVALEGSQQLSRLERRVNWLGMLANIATLTGLLGTVTGLVSAFHEIELREGIVQASDLSRGIWEALITTVFGLVIAIPCMLASHALENHVGGVELQMRWITMHLDKWLQAGRASAANATAAAAGPGVGALAVAGNLPVPKPSAMPVAEHVG